MTTYEVEVHGSWYDAADDVERQENFKLQYATEAEARVDIDILKKIIAHPIRLGQASASDWLGFDGPEAIFEAEEAIVDRLAALIGYDVVLDRIVSFQRVTREKLEF
jgi:hypothetical protein